MNIGSAAAGYGYEYVVSTMDAYQRCSIRTERQYAADAYYYTCIAEMHGQLKEATASEADMPEWGSADERGIDMEVMTAAADLAAGF